MQDNNKIWLALGGGGQRAASLNTGVLDNFDDKFHTRVQQEKFHLEKLSAVSGSAYALGPLMVSRLRSLETKEEAYAKTMDLLFRAWWNWFSIIVVVIIIFVPGNILGITELFTDEQFPESCPAIPVSSSVSMMATLSSLTSIVLISVGGLFIIRRIIHLFQDLTEFCRRKPVLSAIREEVTSFRAQQSQVRVLDENVAPAVPTWRRLWRRRIETHLGYLVSTNEAEGWFDELDEPANISLLKQMFFFVCAIWIAFFDTCWFMICHLFAPLFLTMLAVFPGCIVITQLLLATPAVSNSLIWFYVPTNCPAIVENTEFWLATSTKTNSTIVAKPAQVVFVIPFFFASALVIASLARVFLEYATRIFQTKASFSYPLMSEESKLESFRSIILLILMSTGWLFSTVLSGTGLQCSGLSDLENIVEFAIAFAFTALSIFWIPKRGALILISFLIASFAHYVLLVVGPPPAFLNDELLVFSPPSRITTLSTVAQRNGTVQKLFVESVRYGWKWYIILAAACLIIYTKLSAAKNLVVFSYYRHRISRSFFPSKRTSRYNLLKLNLKGRPLIERVGVLVTRMTLGVLDIIFHDIFRVPFSFTTCEFFPCDEARFCEVQAALENYGSESFPIISIQIAVQLWDVNFTGKIDKKTGTYLHSDHSTIGGVQAASVYFGTHNAHVPADFQIDDENTLFYDTSSRFSESVLNRIDRRQPGSKKMVSTKFTSEEYGQELTVITGTAASAGAVGAYVGVESAGPFFPSSMVSFIGGCCGRWLRLRPQRVPEYFLEFVITFAFVGIGSFLFYGGYSCCPPSDTSVWVAGTDPCPDVSSVLVPSAIIISLVAGIIFSLLAIPYLSNTVFYLGIVSNNFVANVIALSGTSFYSNVSNPFRCFFCCRSRREATTVGHEREGAFEADVAEVISTTIPSRILASDGGHFEPTGIIPLLRDVHDRWIAHDVIGQEIARLNETGDCDIPKLIDALMQVKEKSGRYAGILISQATKKEDIQSQLPYLEEETRSIKVDFDPVIIMMDSTNGFEHVSTLMSAVSYVKQLLNLDAKIEDPWPNIKAFFGDSLMNLSRDEILLLVKLAGDQISNLSLAGFLKSFDSTRAFEHYPADEDEERQQLVEGEEADLPQGASREYLRLSFTLEAVPDNRVTVYYAKPKDRAADEPVVSAFGWDRTLHARMVTMFLVVTPLFTLLGFAIESFVNLLLILSPSARQDVDTDEDAYMIEPSIRGWFGMILCIFIFIMVLVTSTSKSRPASSYMGSIMALSLFPILQGVAAGVVFQSDENSFILLQSGYIGVYFMFGVVLSFFLALPPFFPIVIGTFPNYATASNNLFGDANEFKQLCAKGKRIFEEILQDIGARREIPPTKQSTSKSRAEIMKEKIEMKTALLKRLFAAGEGKLLKTPIEIPPMKAADYYAYSLFVLIAPFALIIWIIWTLAAFPLGLIGAMYINYFVKAPTDRDDSWAFHILCYITYPYAAILYAISAVYWWVLFFFIMLACLPFALVRAVFFGKASTIANNFRLLYPWMKFNHFSYFMVARAVLGQIHRQGVFEFFFGRHVIGGIGSTVAYVPMFKYLYQSNPLLYDLEEVFINQWSVPITHPERKEVINRLRKLKCRFKVEEDERKRIDEQVFFVHYPYGKNPECGGSVIGCQFPGNSKMVNFTNTVHAHPEYRNEYTMPGKSCRSPEGHTGIFAVYLNWFSYHFVTGYVEADSREDLGLEHPMWCILDKTSHLGMKSYGWVNDLFEAFIPDGVTELIMSDDDKGGFGNAI